MTEAAADPATAPGGMRTRVARGTVINAVFLIGVNFVNIARGLLVVGFLTAADYGVWGIVFVTVSLLQAIRGQVISDRFVQQRESDQTLAFQRAFTMELIFAGSLVLAALVLAPLLAVAYGNGELVAPFLVTALALPGAALQAPLSVFYRELQFGRQRLLQSIDPLVATAVTLTLAATGAGYWSVVAGVVAGAWATAVVALAVCPYPIRLRFSRSIARDYVAFSWPLVLSAASGSIMGQAIMLTSERTLGLAAAGAITLTTTISMYANRVDQAISASIYPALCAARDRTDVLFEAFVKSNRLALLWGAPFGLGLSLFGADLVHFLLSPSWDPAIVLLQATGIMAAVHQIAFNWDAFHRAAGQTRPIAVGAIVGTVSFFVLCVPSLVLFGLEGLAAGFLAMEIVSTIVRTRFAKRMFPQLRLAGHALRGFGPALIAAVVVIVARLLESGPRSELMAIAEGLSFGVIAIGLTFAFERSLVREVFQYVRPSASATPA